MNAISVVGLALAWLMIGLGCLLGWQLLRQNGRILLRLDEIEKQLNELEFGGADEPQGLDVGSEAPPFELPDLSGQRHTLAQYRGHSVLLIFFNPACGFCRELAPKLAARYGAPRQPKRDVASASAPLSGGSTPNDVVPGAIQTAPSQSADGLPVPLIITTGDQEQNRQLLGAANLTVLLQNGMELGNRYQASGTPTGYLINAQGKIASSLAVGAEALLALADRMPQSDESPAGPAPALDEKDRANRFSSRSLAKSKIKRDGLKAGTPAPNFRLPRLDGRGELSLEELRGRRVLLVFSDPHCGPCSAVAPKLERLYRQHADIEFVMVSRGEPKENRAKVKEQGLTFPVVLQRQWEVSRLYAMFATPMAYLIDKNGILEADVAVGVEPILALASKAVEGAPAQQPPPR